MSARYAGLKNEKGSTLLLVLLVLALVTFIGISATTTSNLEMLIGGADKRQKMAFYEAEGGTEVGIELVEEGIARGGFDDDGSGNFEHGEVRGPSKNMFLNDVPDPAALDTPDAFFPKDYTGDQPHTNLFVGGASGLSEGGAIIFGAGYEGKGKASGASGAYVLYDIYSERYGPRNSSAEVRIQWQHVM